MEIILSKQCKSLTGTLGRAHGYYIQRRKKSDGSVGFFSQRCPGGRHSRDGHLRFIFDCAALAQMKLHITDVRVPIDELIDAYWEAGLLDLANRITDVRVPIDELIDAYWEAGLLNLANRMVINKKGFPPVLDAGYICRNFIKIRNS